MSELAYNQHGDRFDVPADAAFWRVRRFKAPGTRGAPEVVYDEDGLPLSVPIDISMAEFRDAVDSTPGRYRLDPIDERGAASGDVAAYIQVRETSKKAPKSILEAQDPQDSLIRELVRANTEMVKTITDKFAQVMESAAVLVRAADGAGIAARKPLEIPVLAASPQASAPTDTDDEEEHEDKETAPNSVLANVLQMALEKAMPLISHAIHTKVMGLSSAQSMALLGNTSVHAPTMPASHTTDSSQAIAENESAEFVEEDIDDEDVEESEKEAKESNEAAPNKTRDTGPLAFVSHLAAIESHLSADDIDAIKVLITTLSADELVSWKAKLMQTPPDDAAAMIVKEVRARKLKGRGS